MIKNSHRISTIILLLTILNACGDSSDKSKTPATTTTTQSEEAKITTPPETMAADKKPTATAAPSQVAASSPEADMPATATTTDVSQAAKPTDSKSVEALALAQKSGCLACHKVDSKVVGPAWQDVAKRYANNPDAKPTLLKKVAKGGKGNWSKITGGIAMPPYSPRVSADNIEKLVDFILSLK